MDGAEDDFSSLSVDDRLQHKNWKARVSAYEDLTKSFRTSVAEDAPEFTRDPASLAKAILDANVVAQEKGIETACAYIELGGRPAALRARDQFTAALRDKGLWGATRAGTKKAAIELCLLLVECEGSADAVFEAGVIDGLKSKQPKAVAGAVTVLKELVKQFGVKVVNPKPILKTIPIIFAHADKSVRAEGTLLVQELHRWIGSALDPHLSELKPVQIKELNESFAGEEKPSQTRLTRAQQRERALKEAEASLEGNSKQNGEQEAAETEGDAPDELVDPMDFSDPVSILDKLPPDFYDMLVSSKWKERKELALEPLLETLKRSPKIVDANYEELVRALAGRMSDANIVCVIAAANCIECMAKGLKTAFSRYKPMTLPPILERCKEKKQSVTDALAAALDAAAASVSISDIIEEVTTFAKHKNPQVKEQTYRWLIRCLRTTRVAPNLKTDLKPLSDCLVSGFEDSFEPVRTAAAEGLGTLIKIVGDRPMTATMEQLDDIRKTKVKEFAEKAEVKCKAGAGVSAAPIKAMVPSTAPIRIAATSKAPVSRAVASPTSDKENAPPVSVPKLHSSPPPTPKLMKGAPSRLMAKKPLAAAAPSVKKVVPVSAPAMGKAPSASKSAPNEPLKYKMSQEDAEAQAESVLPSNIYSELANSNWKLRLAAMEELQAWLEGDGNTTEAELIVRVLNKKPGWKESNFQVYGKMTSIFQHLATQSASWSRACSALTIGPMSDKLGDIKLKKPVGEALIAYAEKFSLQFVLSQAYDPMTKQKAPKAQADALLWVEQSLRDFGIQGIAIRDLIEFLKNGLKSSNAAVRTSATKTLVTLRLYVGADIKTFLQDLNPTLLTTIDTEFEKVNGESAPEPTRQSGENAASAVDSNGGATGKASKGGQDALDDLSPRQDLDKLVPHSLVAGLNDANWKTRKEALEQIQGILEVNKRLKPNLGETGPALKMRLADSNKMVQGLALDVIARIATGMDKGFEKHARIFLAGTVAILADAKANARAPAISTLTAICEACGLECMLSGLATGLETTNPMQRRELATWLEVQLERSSTRIDLALIVGPAVACLEDRSAEVRKAAQSLLPYIVAACGYQTLLDKANALKPASRSAVLPLLESAKSAAPKSTTHVVETAAGPDPLKPSRPGSAASGGPLDTAATKAPGRAPTAINRPLKASASLAQGSSRSATPTEPNSASASLHKALPPRKALVPKALAVSPSFSATPTDGSDGVSEPPLRASDPSAKQNRGARETGPLKWSIETSARPDQVEYLHHQMAPHASSQLMSMLFSKGQHCERDFLSGLSTLVDATSQETATAYSLNVDQLKMNMITNADLVLKYLTIRLSDSATVIVLKCFDVYETILTAMLDLGNHLSDHEAGAFLPSLIAKLGDGKETIRVRVKALLKSTGSIYPSSKIFTALLDHGTKAKNARTRSESTEELGGLLLRQGQSVCQPSKALPVIAALISDKDSSCRSAALSALANAYTLLGDAVYRLVGDLQDRERSMLEEKLKRTHTGVGSPTRFGATGTTPSRPDSRQSGAIRPDSRVGMGKPSGISRLPAAAGVKRRISSIPVADPATHQVSRDSHLPQPRAFHQAKVPSQSPEEPLRTLATRQRMVSDEAEPVFDSVNGSPELEGGQYGSILVDNPNQAVEALKQVQHDIASEPDRIAASSDVLIRAICQSSAKAFHDLDADTPQTVLRLCKHLMQTLSNFFDQKLLSVTVSREVLVLLLEELTRRLLETSSNAASDAITSLSKVLNMILIRIFHNTERSACFGALFTLLQTSSQNLRELKGDKLSEQSKYAELVMKCLWKVSKTAKECLENKTLDARHLLFDIDQFLQTIPPAEWRRRAADGVPLGDMPLRTVKTVLQQVVATFGEAVYEELTLIDRPENSFVYQYLFRLLNNARSINVPAENSPSRQIPQKTTSPHHSGMAGNGHSHNGSVPSPSVTVTRMDNTRLNNALKDIFDKIGNAQKSKEGIAELYQFQKEHPEAEARINTWITATGSFFQSYLKRALSNLAADENERATPASPRSSLSPTLSPPPSRPTSSFSSQSVSTNSPRHSVAHDERLDSLKRMFS